jgi:hypothetical protein
VTEPADRLRALQAIVEHAAPGRWSQVRPPSVQELRATMVLRLPIVEASAKVRGGGPLDEAEDLGWPCWAGHVPLRLVPLTPVPDGAGAGAPPAWRGDAAVTARDGTR